MSTKEKQDRLFASDRELQHGDEAYGRFSSLRSSPHWRLGPWTVTLNGQRVGFVFWADTRRGVIKQFENRDGQIVGAPGRRGTFDVRHITRRGRVRVFRGTLASVAERTRGRRQP
jgi:hypothetical protein